MYVVYFLFSYDGRGYGNPYTQSDTPNHFDYSGTSDEYDRTVTSIFMVPGTIDPMED